MKIVKHKCWGTLYKKYDNRAYSDLFTLHLESELVSAAS